jgi:di/tricarboxylate transporter
MDQPTKTRPPQRPTTPLLVQAERWWQRHETRVEVVALALAVLLLVLGRWLTFGPFVVLGVVAMVAAVLAFVIGAAIDIWREAESGP